MPLRKPAVLAFSALLPAAVLPLAAQESAPNRNIHLTIGVNLQGRPAFEGAKGFAFAALPAGGLFIGPPSRKFSGTRDSISFGIIDGGWYRFGPAASFKFPRRESSDRNLQGLGKTQFAAEPGLFLDLFPAAWARLRAEFRHGVGGHHGLIADFAADAFHSPWNGWTFSAGPRLSLADSRYADKYFGVSALQSQRSGLPRYSSSGGLRSAGFGGAISWQATPAIDAKLYAEYDRLLSGFARSPIVTQRGSANQLTFGLKTTYSFDTGLKSPF